MTERIPTANLYAPSTYTPPTQGLTVSYYGDQTNGLTMAQNPTIQKAFTRYDANIYDSWAGNRTEYSQLTSSDSFSARWTGLITAPCTGMYEFQTNGNVDDGGRLYIDQLRVANTWAIGAFYGAVYLAAGDHDFKFSYFETTPTPPCSCSGRSIVRRAATMTAIPQSAFKPSGDTNRSGAVRDSGDNANGTYLLHLADAPSRR
ncbi:MAG: PA14 domain-containing protein [Gammaproteobacteria bacterium]